MAKMFLSFLGTNKYVKCHYEYGDMRSGAVNFVQEALAEMFCSDWKENDSIVIFITDEAEDKNWKRAEDAETGNEIPGLEAKLGDFARSRNMSLKPVKIPSGKDKKEIAEIFNAIVACVPGNTEIIMDVTHAFRAIPMLAVVAINFLKQIKNVEFKGLYYGAFETLGRLEEIKKKDIASRIAPIFDLSDFVNIIDFSNAVYSFVETGNAEMLTKQAYENILKPIVKENKTAQKLRQVMSDVNSITKDFSYCRGIEIIKRDYKKLHDEIETLSKEVQTSGSPEIAYLGALLEKVNEKLNIFKDFDAAENALKGIVAAGWCLQHGLIQQSITIAQEAMLTYVCMKYITKEDVQKEEEKEKENQENNKKINKKNNKKKNDKTQPYQDRDVREKVKDVIIEIGNSYNEQNQENKTNYEGIKQKLYQGLISDDLIEFCKIYNEATNYRNDINHAGFRKYPLDSDKLKEKIKAFISKLKDCVMGIKSRM